MASRARVEEYRSLNASLVDLAKADLERFWATLDTSDVAAARDALSDFMAALSDTYGRPAALIAAQFYDDMRAASAATGKFRAALADGPDREQIAATARWIVGPLVGDEPDSPAALQRALGSAQRYITESGRRTIALASSRDPASTGWARVPQGLSTCAWCSILASRGFVYGSEKAAKFASDGDKYHDDCDCAAVPGFADDERLDGYDPDALYADYKQAREASGSGDIKDIAAELRAATGTN